EEGGLEVAHASGMAALAVPHRRHHLACLGKVWVQARHVLAEHVGRRVAERLRRAIVVKGDDAVAVDGDDDVGRVFEQLLEVDGGKTRGSHGVPKKPPMLSSMTRVVKAKYAFVARVCVAVASGCYWRTYPDQLRTHTDLLVAFARKARDLVATGRFTAENLPELTYPLERAAAYAADARRRTTAPPPSLDAFDRLI